MKCYPFGKGPWPCLNPVPDHYKENVIQECNITDDYNTRKPVGTFNCSCGFIYTSKCPDKSIDDIYSIGAIKRFGSVRENKLLIYL